MDVNAGDIHEKQFHDAWRGYNQEEVDDFLDRVAEALDLAQRENQAVSQRVAELEQAVATSREAEEMLKKTLVAAQQAGEEAIAQAKAKAARMVKEAEERLQRARDESQEKTASTDADIRRKVLEANRDHMARRRDLDGSVERLRAYEAELKQRLKTFMEQQLKSLETLADRDPSLSRPAATASRRHPEVRVTQTPPNSQTARRPAPASGAEQRGGRPESDQPTANEGEADDVVELPAEQDAGGPQRRSVRSLLWRGDA